MKILKKRENKREIEWLLSFELITSLALNAYDFSLPHSKEEQQAATHLGS